jgi:hypothetical protein
MTQCDARRRVRSPLDSTSPRRRMVGLLMAGVLAGCAAAALPAPADFPFHATQPPFLTLHWRLDRPDGRVTATGVLELGQADRLVDVTVALEGLDREGRVVSRGKSVIGPRAFTGDVRWPFTVSLRPTGTEDRFVVRVSDLTWKAERGMR